ncbi:ly6/PLAUR domain-containing protein 2-like [Osmerus eperlanus]|uniref:ly6/PLAUR domain-containing protein 2-like n=1 Tax=Osmerus eperlanus TaxID=29151 RepID=UPI002E15E4FD
MDLIPAVLLLFLPTVEVLKCYVCSSTNSNEECNQATQTCQAPLDTCMTTIDTLNGVKAIVKHCSSSRTCNGAAAGATVDVNGNGNQVNCCSSNQCNVNGATSLKTQALLQLSVALAVCVRALINLASG